MALDLENPEVKSEIDSLVEERLQAQRAELETEFSTTLAEKVTGLERKTKELLGEKKSEQGEKKALLKALGGRDPEVVSKLLEQIDRAELGDLLEKGDLETYNKRITERLKTESEAQLATERTRAEQLEAQAKAYKSRVEELEINQGLQGEFIAAKGRSDQAAQRFMLAAAKDVWKVNEEGQVEARDPVSGELIKGKNGLLTQGEWIQDYLRVEAPFLFEGVVGSGAAGGTSKGSTKSRTQMSADEKVAFISEHGAEAYAELPVN